MELAFIQRAVLVTILLFFSVYGQAKSTQYSLMLMGGGMSFCSSVNEEHCEVPLKISSSTHREDVYQITPEAIERVKQSHWRLNRQSIKQQAVQLLTALSTQQAPLLSKKQLINKIRNSRAQYAGQNISGSTFWRRLAEEEQVHLFDLLQLANVKQSLIGGGERRVVEASLSKTKNKFTTGLIREYVNLVSRLAKKEEKPNILLVTSAMRDPFAQVDLYSQILAQAGADVVWLPLDASFIALAEGKRLGLGKPEQNCQKLSSYRALYQNSHRREDIYPDLANYQLAHCTEPELLRAMVNKANGIFFAPGDPSLLTSSFLTENGEPSNLLRELKSKVTRGDLIVAADDGATLAMSGGRLNGKLGTSQGRNLASARPVAMITNGSSLEGLKSGALAKRAPTKNCDRNDSCPAGVNDQSVTFNANGGLGFFDLGILDIRLSERARQGRLIRVATDSGVDHGYGIDERTALLVGLKDEFDGDLNMEVYGESGVYIVDSSEVIKTTEFRPKLSGVKTHYLTHEDKVFFRGNKFIVSFADWKYSVNNASRPVIQSGKTFSRDNYRRMTNLLCLTSSSNAMLKHVNIGKGFSIKIQKGRTSISLTGSRNVNGLNYASCSYRDYYLDIEAI